jgi:hypothetical protein
MTDLLTLAATLLANFRTIRLPPDDQPRQPSPSAPNWLQLAKARLASRRAAYAARDRILRELVAQGYHRFLHHVEPDPLGGWRLHLFAADAGAIPLLERIADGKIASGQPVDFNPEEFLKERLRRLQRPDECSG